MKVFKVCFQIILSRLPMLVIYIGIYLVIALLVTQLSGGSMTPTFTASKSNLTIYNEAGDSPLAQGLCDYLKKHSILVSVKDDTQTRQDALFFQKTDAYLRIPAGFSANFEQGKASVSLTTRPNNISAVYTRQLIDRYLNLVDLYAASLPQLSEAQAAQKAAETAELSADVSIKSFGAVAGAGKVEFFFSYLAVSVIAVMVLSVTSVMQTFQDTDLRRRNFSAPLRPAAMNAQVILSNVVFALGVWAVISATGGIYGVSVLTAPRFLLYAVNLLVLTLVGLGIGFLTSSLTKSFNAANAVANIASMGMAFLCGVFVPQEYMSSGVLAAAHFLPVYWYVRANEAIEGLSTFTFSALTPIWQAIGIQTLFVAVLLLLPAFIGRMHRQGAH